MNREAGDSFGSLGDFVDSIGLQSENAKAAKLVEQKAQLPWREDNLFILDYLKRSVNILNFEGIVEEQREILRELPKYNDRQMVVRKLNWIPDSSRETRESEGPRLRAVYGNAVLLSSNTKDGVDGNIVKGYGIESTYYSLCVAVEDAKNDQLHFYMMAAPDLQRSPRRHSLYTALTNEAYEVAVTGYYLETGIATFRERGSSSITIAFDNEQSEEERFGNLWRRYEEIGETPMESSYSFNTQKITNLLVVNPTVVKSSMMKRMQDRFTGNRSDEKPAPTYAQYLKPLNDWEHTLNHTLLKSNFENYLLTNPIFRHG